MTDNRPFFLKPAAKSYIWGGTRLNDDFSKNIDLDPLAETWECSTHPDGISLVASGDCKGRKLTDVLAEHPEYLGTHPRSHGLAEGQLPILIKLIDAKADLSVQVHPDDEYAKKYENGSLGKAEMWYVLDAKQRTSLVYGLNKNVSKDEMISRIRSGTLNSILRKVSVHKNDVFFIEPGTIHAIGAGALIAEIQESSNLTYRLYDYDRVDSHGLRRPLHIEKALNVANLKRSAEPRQPIRILKYRNGYASELLSRCRYFQVERVLINTERIRELVPFKTSQESFEVLLCIDGCGMAVIENEHLPIFKGDCIFMPADSAEIKLHGYMTLLRVSC